MKCFIAYFDLLGYKEFILKSDALITRRRINNILRDIETSLSSKLKLSQNNKDAIADLQEAKIHCLNISDTIIFYSKDNSVGSLQEILDVAFKFNWKTNRHNFPARGILVYEEFEMISDMYTNAAGISYRPNIIYGKGLVTAHIKCDLQQWAGCCIDVSMNEIFKTSGISVNSYIVRWDVPINSKKENPFGTFSNFAFRLYSGGADGTTLENLKEQIRTQFASDNKSIDSKDIIPKLDNTFRFIEYLKDK